MYKIVPDYVIMTVKLLFVTSAQMTKRRFHINDCVFFLNSRNVLYHRGFFFCNS